MAKSLSSAVLPLLLLVLAVLLSSVIVPMLKPKAIDTSMAATASTTNEIFGVKIERNPPQSKLDELGVTKWKKWSGLPSTIPWTFEATETMYILEGKVKISVEGYEGSFEIKAGDLAVFPKGMKITFEVLEAVSKHFSLEE